MISIKNNVNIVRCYCYNKYLMEAKLKIYGYKDTNLCKWKYLLQYDNHLLKKFSIILYTCLCVYHIHDVVT